ncbi:hypothetical protein Mia14_0486 [Candidatus Mancarchaeum acidiphilum]|uniref:Uncharacterized protein n=1 Tax=Candidatus Mancarchaeum acidiphilum TaxID=1920749 RepID=A0A218NMT6_9ARCH|nr:hypothetical protein [Candidatus Mancarchaeum acidiphilum]ASI13800.1 hypothetical protein Mia14_0486 [Candidatus Mancarchaeum acidiphilum]
MKMPKNKTKINDGFTERQLLDDTNAKIAGLSRLSDNDTAKLITDYLKENFDPSEADKRLSEILDFVESLDQRDTRYRYFHAIWSTKAVKELTSERTMKFANSIGVNNSYGYFYAIENTKAVKELTSEEFTNKKTADFINLIGNYSNFEYFNAVGTTKAVKELTSKRVFDFAKLIGINVDKYFYAVGSTKAVAELTSEEIANRRIADFINLSNNSFGYEYFGAVGKTKAVKELTSGEVIDFAKSLGSNIDKYFSAIESTKAVKELTSKEVIGKRIADFINLIGRTSASEYFNAIGYTEAVAELTSGEVVNEGTVNFIKSIGSYGSNRYFYAIGMTRAVKELTSKRVRDFAISLGNNNVYGYFRAMADSKAVAELTSGEVINETITNFVDSIGGDSSYQYFYAIGMTKAVAELTSERVRDFARYVGYNASFEYFRAIRKTKAAKELTDEVFLSWLKDSYTMNDFMDILTGIANILYYSDNHNLNKGLTFLEDPIIRLIKFENASKDPNRFKAEVLGWSNLIKNLETIENGNLGSIDEAKFDRIVKLYSRTGGSVEYLSIASNFIKTKEDFETLFSGEKGKIDNIIVNGANSYFNNLKGLPKSVEGWGGIKILRLVWENKNMFTPEFLVESLKRRSNPSELHIDEFKHIDSLLPEFNKQYIKTYDLHQEKKTEELTREETSKIISDSISIIKGVFPENAVDVPQALGQIQTELASLRNSVGRGLRSRIDYIVGKSDIDDNPESVNFQKAIFLAKGLKKIEKDINNIADENKGDALYSYGRILNAVEGVMASKYYREKIGDQENALEEARRSLMEGAEMPKEEMELYIKKADEALSNIYQYMTDPDMFIVDSPGRRMLFGLYLNTISEDSEKLDKSLPTAGVLTIKSWKRSLDDIFGGRYSGDCTAPPNESDYSGIHFDANFRWVKDPATLILNFYWKEKLEDVPQPIGRTYCFAAEVDGKPMLFIDSLEFLSSFYPGIEVQKALPEMIKDLAKHFNVPVVINTGRVSNREWVNDVIGNAGFNKKTISIKKLGNDVFAEHIETSLLRKEQYFVAP